MRRAALFLGFALAECEPSPPPRADLRGPAKPQTSPSIGASAQAAAPAPAGAVTSAPPLRAADRKLGCGHSVACVVDADGSVRCWGRNDFGQVGNGKRAGALVAAGAAVAGLPPAASVAVGVHHVCALTRDGAVFCWGAGYAGQLGDGSALAGPESEAKGRPPASAKPVMVKGLPKRAVSVDAGTLHTCAVLESGRVACWGDNEQAQLGMGGPSRSSPAIVPGVEGAGEIACGAGHTCARLSDGAVTCWGSVGRSSGGAPATVAGLCARQITSGSGFSCAIACAGGALCWGTVPGRPGGGEGLDVGLAPAPGDFSDAVEIRAGYWHACARGGGGAMSCWGGDDSGQLGHPKGPNWSEDFLERAGAVAKTWKGTEAICAGGMSVRPGPAHRRPAGVVESGATCALSDEGDAFCWGEPALNYTPKKITRRRP